MDPYYEFPMQTLANKIFAESFVVEREAEAAEAQDKLEYAEALTEKEKAERDANDAHLYA